ncbi:MAG: hypothetical protein RL095_1824 [Verrucomicrobiota bacterium]|jgi:flagellar hook-associated protein 2
MSTINTSSYGADKAVELPRMRFGGISSGQDTQAMVDSMLQAARLPVKRLELDTQRDEEKIAAWDEIDVKISALGTKVNSLSSFTTWNQKIAAASDSGVVSAAVDRTAALGKYSVEVTTLAQAHRVASDAQSSATEALNFAGDFTLNGQTITVAAEDTVKSIRDKINAASGSMSDKVKASVVGTSLVIERANTGDTAMTLSDGSGGVAALLGLDDGAGGFKNELQVGANLDAKVNGVAVTGTSNSKRTDVVEGLTLNFTKAGTSTLEITRDTSSLVTAFKDFITAYNEAMDTAESYTRVTLSSGGGKITSKGLLQGDAAVTALRFRSRSLVSASFHNPATDPGATPSVNTLQDLGIWTEGRDNRLALISEDKLTNALKNNFDDAEDFARDFNKGVFRKLRDFIDTATSPIDGTIARRKSGLEGQIQKRDVRINFLNFQIADKETQLWERFSSMEETLASIKSQSSYISSSLGQKT